MRPWALLRIPFGEENRLRFRRAGLVRGERMPLNCNRIDPRWNALFPHSLSAERLPREHHEVCEYSYRTFSFFFGPTTLQSNCSPVAIDASLAE